MKHRDKAIVAGIAAAALVGAELFDHGKPHAALTVPAVVSNMGANIAFTNVSAAVVWSPSTATPAVHFLEIKA